MAAHRLLRVLDAVVRFDKLAVVARVGQVEERAGGGRLALRGVELDAGGAERVHVRAPALEVEQLEVAHAGHGKQCHARTARYLGGRPAVVMLDNRENLRLVR